MEAVSAHACKVLRKTIVRGRWEIRQGQVELIGTIFSVQFVIVRLLLPVSYDDCNDNGNDHQLRFKFQ